MNKTTLLYFILSLFLIQKIYLAQVSLVQTFTEASIIGNTGFGNSFSTTVDLNNDNYDDIIVGASTYGGNTGRVYVYFGGSNADNIADIILTGETTYSFFGSSVSGVGDVNGDSYDDLIVGAYGYGNFDGRAYVYFGGANMDNAADIIITPESSYDNFGNSVSSAGDVNGDGYTDIVIGTVSAEAYLYYGGNNMDNIADVVFYGANAFGLWAHQVSTLGDINGDNFDDIFILNTWDPAVCIYFGGNTMDNVADIIISDYNVGGGLSLAGAGDLNGDNYDDFAILSLLDEESYLINVFIYFGGNDVNNSPDIVFDCESGSIFNFCISGAGDVNGDDYDDLIVGNRDYNNGAAFIYFGGQQMDGAKDVNMLNETMEAHFGGIVSGMGDINGDNYDDVIINASGHNNFTGAAYVYYGGSSMDGSPDLIMWGEGTNNSRFGYSLSGAGDLNNDGYNDIIIGAHDDGRVFIYNGNSTIDNSPDVILTGDRNILYGLTVSGVGDVNGDDFSDVVIGTYGQYAYIYLGGININTNHYLQLSSNETSYYFGAVVKGVGDINSDGFCDVIVGEQYYKYDTGRVHIFLGGEEMDNSADIILTGEDENNYFGRAVSGNGDINGDGYNDIIVGARNYNNGDGRAYLYWGGNIINSEPGLILNGNSSNERFGSSVSILGDINNDGYDDVAVGAYGYNNYRGRLYIFNGGSNTDDFAEIIIIGENDYDYYGLAVSGIGDINSDGYDDIAVGAYGYSSETGKVYIYYGGVEMDDVADYTINGENTSDKFGFSISCAGDMNNDGYDEILIGAENYQNNGKAYLYSFNTIIGVEETDSYIPNDYQLYQNYPNPFNPSTKISFNIPKKELVKIRIYSLLGEFITELVNNVLNAGYHEVTFKASNLRSGIYYYNIKSGDYSETKKMIFLK